MGYEAGLLEAATGLDTARGTDDYGCDGMGQSIIQMQFLRTEEKTDIRSGVRAAALVDEAVGAPVDMVLLQRCMA